MPSNTKIRLSGNPFVDTGLATIAARASVDDLDQLTIDDLRKVHGDGHQIANWNSSLKCFRMAFTTNSLLTNPSIKEKSRKPAYVAAVNAMLSAIYSDDLKRRCQACGSERSLDLDALCRRAIPADVLGEQKRSIGRDWFPLAGSLGSDAQSLPAATEPVNLCSLCLFSVQYLPLGLRLLDGRLAVFQCESVPFWYEIARDVACKVSHRVSAGIYETIGKKEGTAAFVLQLLDLFERLQRSTAMKEVPEGTSLRIWRFSNGKSADCSVDEIPNASLTFLWQAARSGRREELAELIRKEGNRERSFLSCIAEGSDYAGLYPRGRSQGVSPGLFCLYQESVCRRPTAALNTAQRIAISFVRSAPAAQTARACREGAFDEPSVRDALRVQMIKAAEEGKLSLHEYQVLFPTSLEHGARISWDGWKLIRYFLNHAEFSLSSSNKPPDHTTEARAIEYYASAIFRNYTDNHGVEAFQRNVLQAFRQRRISLTWAQDQFSVLGESIQGFSWPNWVHLFGDPPAVAEPLFQMRLLWSEWARGGPPDHLGEPPFFESNSLSGLERPIEEALRMFFAAYCTHRGRERFHRDVLLRLRRKEIGLRSLSGWLTTWTLHKETEPLCAWSKCFPDHGDNAATSDFFFKIRLLLANLYRTEQPVR